MSGAQRSYIVDNIKPFEAAHDGHSHNFFANALGFEFAGNLVDGSTQANGIVDLKELVVCV